MHNIKIIQQWHVRELHVGLDGWVDGHRMDGHWLTAKIHHAGTKCKGASNGNGNIVHLSNIHLL